MSKLAEKTSGKGKAIATLFGFVLVSCRELGLSVDEISSMFSKKSVTAGYKILDDKKHANNLD